MNNSPIKEKFETDIECVEYMLKCGVVHPRDYGIVMNYLDFMDATIHKIEEADFDAGIKALCKKVPPHEELNEGLLPYSETDDDSESEASFRRKRADEYQL